MESKREQNKKDCQERILRSSMKLFKKNGFDETLISDVARKAGISRATLYNYFPSKDSLLLGIAQKELTRLHKEVTVKMKEETPWDRLLYMMKLFIDDSNQYKDISRKMILMNAEKDSFLFETRQQLMGMLRALVEECKQDEYLDADADTDLIVEMLHAAFLSTQLYWLDTETLDRDECDRRVEWTVLRFLGSVTRV